MRIPPALRPFVRSAGALAILAGALGGCIKYKDRTVLLPDGSGKFSISLAMKTAFLKLAETQAKEEGEDLAGALDLDPGRLRKDFEGFVAFGDPVKTVEGDWTHITVTGYFEDVNKVKVWKDETLAGDDEKGAAAGRELMVGFKFAKEGDGFVLEQTSGMFDDMAELGESDDEDDPDMTPEMKKATAEMAKVMLKGMFDGLEVTSAVEMPGKVTKAEGHEPKDGRLASTSISLDDILDDAKREKLEKRKAIKVWCGPADLTAEQVKTFRDEMATAKTAWAKAVADFDARKKAAPAGGPKAPPDPMGPAPGSPPGGPK